jgi:prepilin peptidase CpaA
MSARPAERLTTMDPALMLMVLAGAALLAAAAYDIVCFTIPDRFSLLILVSGLAHGLFGGTDFLAHLAAPALVLAGGLALFHFGVMGGGDIKLLVALAAWTGFADLMTLLVATSLAGGGLALTLLALRHAATGFPGMACPRVLHHAAPIPYAVAIALGSSMTLFLASAR